MFAMVGDTWGDGDSGENVVCSGEGVPRVGVSIGGEQRGERGERRDVGVSWMVSMVDSLSSERTLVGKYCAAPARELLGKDWRRPRGDEWAARFAVLALEGSFMVGFAFVEFLVGEKFLWFMHLGVSVYVCFFREGLVCNVEFVYVYLTAGGIYGFARFVYSGL
jgi:hypothetical protein